MLNDILNNPAIWTGRECRTQYSGAQKHGLDTGFHALNQVLPFSGWPCDGITEVISPYSGMGELSLLIPCLSHISQEEYIIWINAIHSPHGPALKEQSVHLPHLACLTPKSSDILWCAEQSLRSPCCGAIVMWPQRFPNSSSYRRLQMLCAEHQTPLFIILSKAPKQSGCRLRIQITQRHLNHITLTLLKCQHTWATPSVNIALDNIEFWRYPQTLKPKSRLPAKSQC